jgi:hypothetical protein
MIWQLNLQDDYWEPPTLYTYSTAGENELISWARDGRARIHERSTVTDMSWGGGYLFSAIWLEGDRNRRRPDRTTVTSPVTESRELADGILTHAVVDILDLQPHWIASIPLDVGGPPMIEVMSNGHVVIAVNEPRPSLSIYRVVGLWRIKGL